MKLTRQISNLFLTAALLFSGCISRTSDNSQDAESFAARQLPELYSEFVYLEDADTGQILLDINSEASVYPASITKMMTALLAVENSTDLSEVWPITDEIMAGLIEASANRAGFTTGDEPTVEDLLYGTLLPSGAECARALAFYVSGSEEEFVNLMNQKAQMLGMTNTHFANCSGLHDDSLYSTCRDMAILMSYCMKNQEMVRIMTALTYTSSPVKTYPQGLDMQNGVLQYINQTDTKYQNFDIPGFVCGKSGYTLEALYTLASSASEGGMNLVLVNCHGYREAHYPASIADAASLYNWFGEHYAKQTVLTAGDLAAEVRVRNSSVSSLKLIFPETVTGDFPNDENLHVVIQTPEYVNAAVTKGDIIGTVSVYDYDQLVYTVSLTSDVSCPVTSWGKITTFIYEHALWISVTGLSLIVLIIFLGNYQKLFRKRKKKRRRKNK